MLSVNTMYRFLCYFVQYRLGLFPIITQMCTVSTHFYVMISDRTLTLSTGVVAVPLALLLHRFRQRDAL